MLTESAPRPSELPHPVVFDVEYPERHSRWLIFVRWLLIIPQWIIVSLLLQIAGLLAFFAWFAVLFTGRYPRSMHGFVVGCLRWSANVGAYWALLRDEYPPFSLSAGEYALTLEIPYPERLSRWRLFVRWFAVIPNAIVLWFLQIALLLTTFIAWWAILFTGHYPRGLFRFAVGVHRWAQRQSAYTYILRDEFPPYSTRADARPGNEVVSAIIGLPLFVGLIALYVTIAVLALSGGSETTTVNRSLLETPEQFASVRPAVEANDFRITITGMTELLPCPGADPELFATCFSIDVDVEKDTWRPGFYTPYLFTIEYCGSVPWLDNTSGPVEVSGDEFEWWWFGDGEAHSTLYFELGSISMCELNYFSGTGILRFKFQ